MTYHGTAVEDTRFAGMTFVLTGTLSTMKRSEAKELILARWRRTLETTIQEYLDAYVRIFQQDMEHLYDKYTGPLKHILAERDTATARLNAFLKELGYEG